MKLNKLPIPWRCTRCDTKMWMNWQTIGKCFEGKCPTCGTNNVKVVTVDEKCPLEAGCDDFTGWMCTENKAICNQERQDECWQWYLKKG